VKSYFAYIRVSTIKQGEHGSSLLEQRDAIKQFATRNQFRIAAWFEERETAAKTGRREFSRMLTALKKDRASGVIFHKIDRSARNLKDWSAIQDLAEQGIDVRFSQESINLGSNEGKLTGDFLAVIASHYIRNLRDEVKKGVRGRLKQGLYPLAAPLGYLDQGGGKPKIPDPIRAPFIHDAFELYAAGMALPALSDELHRRGLRSRSGNQVSISRLAELLRNPFYIGIIRMRQSGEHYDGIHRPIVSKALFDRVQMVLDGKLNAKIVVHNFLFRRLVACTRCNRHLIGERQKSHVYYRCHTRDCPTCSFREETIDSTVRSSFQPFFLSDDELAELFEMNAGLDADWAIKKTGYENSIALQIDSVSNRLSRLMDAYIDQAVERPLYEEKKLSLLMERKALEGRRTELSADQPSVPRKIRDFLELVKTLPLTYELGNTQEKRDIVKIVTSNLLADGKNVVVELRSPFQEAANLASFPTGEPLRSEPRTRAQKVFNLLVNYFTEEAEKRRRESFPAAA